MGIRINFSGRSIRYTEEEIATVVEAMRNAEPLTQGKYMRAFEQKFAEFQGVAQGSCFTTMNGCAALEMSAQLCNFAEGDEFVIPSHTFTASCYPYLKKGGRPVWADIDLKTRVVTAESIARAVTKKTKAVVVVHLYGYVADMPEISAFCREKGLLLIEDTAQAIGCEVAGKRAGSFGDMAIFSFHSHKNLTTLGEGGMLYVRDPALWKLVPMLRHNGHCDYHFDRPDYWKPAMGNVDVPMLGERMLMPANLCLGEIECALGAKMLDRIETINAEKRDLFMRKMHDDKGINCVVQYIPLNRYDFYRKLGFGEANCPNADTFFDSMISFPFQHWLSDEDFAYMLQATKEVLHSLA